ncbi:aminoglycoside phosphotransferase family protein [Amycolatopsis sp.]|uniref:aminoglycoside phosphotransferase family protein n=1 Tax=Amycolatopsis sp. TaxID=37632 RepID=UPI002D7E39C6|nr:aminoglycoside phosphotransferase family protein [Amycolatopsis sp.]HET6707093.1 aminoglycoside phosphotransferase family protein [Amycolatopsis sp.]
MTGDDVLQDQPHRRVVRIGDTVRRPIYPWSPAIHALLRHLEAVGFPSTPRVLGVDEEGCEVLTYLEGESGPQGWAKVVDDAGLTGFARLLRDYHDAVADFRPSDELEWSTGEGGSGEVICHGDFGPWNVVWQGGQPVGILDWDYARPGTRLHDVAYALEYVAPFRDDAECLRALRYPRPPDRRHRLELFAGAYGLTSTSGLVDAVIEVQRDGIEQVRRLAAAGHQPQVDWVASGLLAELANRVAWSEAHRHLFE